MCMRGLSKSMSMSHVCAWLCLCSICMPSYVCAPEEEWEPLDLELGCWESNMDPLQKSLSDLNHSGKGHAVYASSP